MYPTRKRELHIITYPISQVVRRRILTPGFTGSMPVWGGILVRGNPRP